MVDAGAAAAQGPRRRDREGDRSADAGAGSCADREEIIEALAARAERYAAPLFPVDDDADGGARSETVGAVEEAYSRVEYREALRPLIEGLPERERRILLLRFFGDQSQSQIAEQIGVSQMHVSRLLAKTLLRLRDGLSAGG